MLINRYFNIKQNCHRKKFHIFLACDVEILVFGGLWCAVEIGLFRMINFVKNGPIKMCGTISLSEICPSLPQDTNTDKSKSE